MSRIGSLPEDASLVSYTGPPDPVYCGYWIHWLHFCSRVRIFNECPGYDTKESDGKAPLIPEHWEMQNNSLLSSVPAPLKPGVVAPDKVLSIGQIERNWIFYI